ncbi:glycosyltransferase family 61 protein [Candidatus Pelagibacter sp. Uisw_113]|uniref:glycosyltransferase family 61 protein n=1 Tax=Candidatus Pelagibacter sp. Uisw_113 TaxID=3230994 RepID=UPI0039EC24F5
MEIKNKLQKFFKIFFQKLFILIYGKILFRKNYNFLKDSTSNKLDEVILDNIKYYCFTITNGRIYTDLVENVAVISNNNLVIGAGFQKINGILKNEIDNACLKKGTPRIKVKKTGTLLALIQDGSENNYSHWLLDILPRLKIIEKNNLIKKIDYFLLPELKYSFQYETLRVLNIPLQKILSNKKNRHVEAHTLIATNHPWYKKGHVRDEMINMPEWIIFWLREKFLLNKIYKNNYKKIYIDRSDSEFNHCKMINPEEVWIFLKNKGFKRLKLTQIDFNEQVSLFNNADIIIGAHGAGLTNIIFANPGTKIIEIQPRRQFNEFFTKISKVNKLNYNRIVSKDLKLNIDNKLGDILVDIKDIEKLLN